VDEQVETAAVSCWVEHIINLKLESSCKKIFHKDCSLWFWL